MVNDNFVKKRLLLVVAAARNRAVAGLRLKLRGHRDQLNAFNPPPPHGTTTPIRPGPPRYRGFTITLRHTVIGRTPLDEWSARRRDHYLPTQHSHKTDIHITGRIRTRNPSKREAAEPCLRPRGHWIRPNAFLLTFIIDVTPIKFQTRQFSF
jgi:hypothetical protein